MMENNELNGFLSFNFKIIQKQTGDLLNNEIENNKLFNDALSDVFFIIINSNLAIPINATSVSPEAIEDAINLWINDSTSENKPVFRGRTTTAKKVVKKLKKLGFDIINTNGSHIQMKKEQHGAKVTIPIHGGDIPKGTLSSILNQAGITWETLLEI